MERTIDSLQNETIQKQKEIIKLLERKIELLIATNTGKKEIITLLKTKIELLTKPS